MSVKEILAGLASTIEEMKPAGAARARLGLTRELINALPDEEPPAKAKRKRVAESVSRETVVDGVSRETRREISLRRQAMRERA